MEEKRMKSTWVLDYDSREDKCYKRPGCPECSEPIGLDEDGQYHCYSCGKVVEVEDPKMIKWFSDREGTKVEYSNCGCGGQNTFETHYVKNPVTLDWQVAFGGCSKCNMRFIV